MPIAFRWVVGGDTFLWSGGFGVRRSPVVIAVLLIATVFFWGSPTLAQDQDTLPSPGELKKLSIEELMDINVISVSRRAERLSETASAIQLVTGYAIGRSGALRLPEALRLAPNLMVAQVNAHDWAITARGFNGAPLTNNSLADKLLVMIDGRTVYTPLFGGVFWDVQNVLLEDIDRIEVVSGPGGTLWGANAVNGVINIITRDSRDTQGIYASVAAGSFLYDRAALRYGGRVGSNVSYRLYGQRFDYGSTALQDESDADDDWNMNQGGLRIDYHISPTSRLTLSGNVYGGSEEGPDVVRINGQNALLSWTHAFSGSSDITLQTYFDRTWRRLPEPGFGDVLRTYDLDLQHRVPIGSRNSFIWGVGYRFMQSEINNSAPLSFVPPRRNLHLLSAFVQDELALVKDQLLLTVGTKMEHHEYADLEFQPSGRLTWLPGKKHTLWAAVSRAIRSPSRFDADVVTPNIVGGRPFASENVLAYEAGYRMQPTDAFSLALAAFYNRYDDLRSINLNPEPPPGLVFANDQEAIASGVEVSGTYQVTNRWRLHGGYTYFHKKIEPTSPAVLDGSAFFEGIDPSHQGLVQSILDLPGRFQFDTVARYVDLLPATLITPRVPPYFSLDVRLAWGYQGWELALVGQNLVEEFHPEFGSRQVPRSIYGILTWRYR